MNPVIEHALVAGAIVASLGYLLSRFLRQHRGGKGCGSDCGCGPAKKNPPLR